MKTSNPPCLTSVVKTLVVLLLFAAPVRGAWIKPTTSPTSAPAVVYSLLETDPHSLHSTGGVAGCLSVDGGSGWLAGPLKVGYPSAGYYEGEYTTNQPGTINLSAGVAAGNVALLTCPGGNITATGGVALGEGDSAIGGSLNLSAGRITMGGGSQDANGGIISMRGGTTGNDEQSQASASGGGIYLDAGLCNLPWRSANGGLFVARGGSNTSGGTLWLDANTQGFLAYYMTTNEILNYLPTTSGTLLNDTAGRRVGRQGRRRGGMGVAEPAGIISDQNKSPRAKGKASDKTKMIDFNRDDLRRLFQRNPM